MTGVENIFYWPGRHNLGPGKQFKQIYLPEKPPGHISPGHLDRCVCCCSNTFTVDFRGALNYDEIVLATKLHHRNLTGP